MVSRFAGRLITGPLAFLAAGAVDVCVFFVGHARESLARRWSGAGSG